MKRAASAATTETSTLGTTPPDVPELATSGASGGRIGANGCPCAAGAVARRTLGSAGFEGFEGCVCTAAAREGWCWGGVLTRSRGTAVTGPTGAPSDTARDALALGAA